MVSNVTFIGTATNKDLVETKSSAVKLKEGTGGDIHNAIFAYSYNAVVELTEEATEIVADAGDIAITDTIFFKSSLADGGASPYKISDGSTWDLKGFIEDAGNRRSVTAARSPAPSPPITSVRSRMQPATGPRAGPTMPRIE